MLKRLWKTDAPLTVTGLLMLPALAIAIIGLIVDPRLITGSPAWLKPAKFAVSIAIYVFTLAWVFTFLPGFPRTRRIVGWVTAIVMVVELSIIGLQAWRGTTSHFNAATAFDSALYMVMGVGILLQTLTSVAVAVALWRQVFEDPAMGWALRLGMTITIIGASSGAFMTQPTADQLAAAHAGQGMPIVGAHTVGAPDGGPGVPGTGWNTGHGDLRIAHFFGLHAIQALPLIAWALRRRPLPGDARVGMIFTAAGSYIALFAILLTQALRGQTVFSFDVVTIERFVILAVVAAVCAWWSLARVSTKGTSQLA